NGVLDELERVVDVAQRLLQVDDVDAVALGEDEALHLRVPTAGLMSEVDAALEQPSHGHDGHGRSPSGRSAPDPGLSHRRAADALVPGTRTAPPTSWGPGPRPCRAFRFDMTCGHAKSPRHRGAVSIVREQSTPTPIDIRA